MAARDAAKYWEDRAKENAEKLYRYAQRKAILITRWFSRATREMQRRIDQFYHQAAVEEAVSPQKAKEIMDRRAVILTLREAQRLAERYPDDQEIRLLLNRAYRQRAVSREEFLQMQLAALATELYGRYAQESERSLTEIYEESYYKGLFDQQQFVGFGSRFNRLSTHQIEAAVSTAWQGKNYSERIWGDHRTSLARYLNRVVTTGVLGGQSNRQMCVQLQKAMDMGAYEARRLIRTEAAQVAGRANLLAYREFGTDQFQFLAVLDFKTSETCREMDGKVFPVEKGRIGVNIPPLHPFCRSTTVPYRPDPEFDADETRTARRSDGSAYRVPAGMTYEQWHRQYVEADPAQALAEKKQRNGRADANQYATYQERLGRDAPETFDAFQQIKYTDAEGWERLKGEYRREGGPKRRGAQSSALTGPEAAAVTRYVSGDSYRINARLRMGMELSEEDRRTAVGLDRALEKLPVFEGPVIRTLVFDGKSELIQFARAHPVGGTVTYPAFTSASVRGGYHEAPTVELRIRSKTGRDLRAYNEPEAEVLFRRGTRFRILAAREENGVVILEVEEEDEGR